MSTITGKIISFLPDSLFTQTFQPPGHSTQLFWLFNYQSQDFSLVYSPYQGDFRKKDVIGSLAQSIDVDNLSHQQAVFITNQISNFIEKNKSLADVEGGCSITSNDKIKFFQLIQSPLIQPCHDRDSIINDLLIYFPKTRFHPNIEEFYNSLTSTYLPELNPTSNDEIPMEEHVSWTLDNLAKLWMFNKEKRKEMIKYFLPLFPKKKDSYQSYQKTIGILLKNWYDNRNIRRLLLIGLTSQEIKLYHHLSEEELFRLATTHPYSLLKLSPTKIEYLCHKFNIVYHQDEYQIAHYIQNVITKNSLTGFPISWITEKNPSFLQNLPSFLEHYPFFYQFNILYPINHYNIEEEVAQKLRHLISRNVENNKDDFPIKNNMVIEDNGTNHIFQDTRKNQNLFFTREEIEKNPQYQLLDHDQKEAVVMALSHWISIIIGLGGTGKSTISLCLSQILESKGYQYQFLSFTGKAVARLKEFVKKRTSTIDLMIAEKKIKTLQYIIIDEASMVTTELFYRLIKSYPQDYVIIFMGDPNQLQPISWGSFFSEIVRYSLNTHKIPLTMLKINHRFSQDSGIYKNSLKLLSFSYDNSPSSQDKKSSLDNDDPPRTLCPGNDFNILNIPSQDIHAIDPRIKDILQHMKDNGVNQKNITIITPYNKYLDKLNQICQQVFHSHVSNDDKLDWVIGDRVSLRENNYFINIMNGEEGIVSKKEKDDIEVYFPQKGKSEKFFYSSIPKNSQEDHEAQTSSLRHSYALTIHLSQGSEWDYIILYLPYEKNNQYFINKNLLYTAITRARKFIWIIGNIDQIQNFMYNTPLEKHDRLSLII